jgi:hypothetical protein
MWRRAQTLPSLQSEAVNYLWSNTTIMFESRRWLNSKENKRTTTAQRENNAKNNNNDNDTPTTSGI